MVKSLLSRTPSANSGGNLSGVEYSERNPTGRVNPGGMMTAKRRRRLQQTGQLDGAEFKGQVSELEQQNGRKNGSLKGEGGPIKFVPGKVDDTTLPKNKKGKLTPSQEAIIRRIKKRQSA